MLRMLTVVGAIALFMSAGCEKEPSSPSEAKSTTESIKDTAGKAAEAGKQAAQDTASKVSDAAGAAWAKIQESGQDYIATLRETTGVMEGVKDELSASAALPKLKDLIPKLTAQGGALSALGAEDRSKLLGEMKDQLPALVEKFKAQVDRLTKDPAISKIFGDTFKGVKLFE